MRPVHCIAVALIGWAASCAATAAPCGVPPTLGDGWTVATPEESGFDAAALCNAVERLATPQTNVHGLLIERRGRLVGEWYFSGTDKPGGAWFARAASFGPADKHDLRSITKSVTSILFGIAQGQGKLPPIDTPVLDLFPEYADLATPERRAITLEHLLTMTPGLEWDESGTYASLNNSETRMKMASDRLRFVLERPLVAPPGTRFTYNGGATALLGDVVARRTGMPLTQFAREALFEPLGIDDVEWRADSKGKAYAWGGLRLRPRDLAKIGRMMLNDGRWGERQVVPAAWVRESLRGRVPAEAGWTYGYQWWSGKLRWRGGALPWIAGFGNGGQRLYLVPSLDLVVVVTAGRYNETASGRASGLLFDGVVGAFTATAAQ